MPCLVMRKRQIFWLETFQHNLADALAMIKAIWTYVYLFWTKMVSEIKKYIFFIRNGVARKNLPI